MAELLCDQLRLMASNLPDEVGYRNLGNGSSITFAEWDRQSNRLARGLAARGVGKGDRVAIYLEAEQILDWIVTYSAVHKLGAVAVPTNNRLSVPEIRAIFEHAEVTAIVTSGTYSRAIVPLLGSLPTLSFVAVAGAVPIEGCLDFESMKSPDDGMIQTPTDEDDLADIMYTSGTTGRPKGVAVRHGVIALLPNGLPEWRGTGWLTASPVFTFAGLGFVHNPMKLGMTALYLPTFDVGQWLEAVERERPTATFVVPAMAQLLIHDPRFEKADLSSLQMVTLGSAPLAPDTLRRLQEALPNAAVLNSYGQTEGGYATFSMDPEGSRTHPGAVGRPKAPVEVRIVDESGVDVALGDVGEVITRFPGKHREYYKDPEATARMWEGGWLRSGDLGHLDADGYLYIVGRRKEMIVRGGMNVYANDVEAVLHAHPAVLEAAVVGVPHDVLGEDVAAFVVLRPGPALSVDQLQEFAAERLAGYKVPRQITYLPELPRNASGKVLKRQLVSEQYEDPRRNHAGPSI
ncbi:MAG: fatty-acyl-CoA synthase [Acidimicrobiaceae bacterium]|nr:fatty-acyl-CoA synthase [Acidimicrobiaceae bacterium]